MRTFRILPTIAAVLAAVAFAVVPADASEPAPPSLAKSGAAAVTEAIAVGLAL
jgi:hypothetical protein